MKFDCDCILLDIEGTTSSISFVHDEMFPYVREQLARFIEVNWQSTELGESMELIGVDAGYRDWPDANLPEAEQQKQVAEEVIRQMDLDLKATGLKNLQGKIWKSGFESGGLKAHLYEDVPGCLETWQAAGKDIRIYSSGSVQAQFLFFGHTIYGDLRPRFSGHYDTQIGSKREASSYQHIAAEVGLDAGRILFVSDLLAELDAACESGMQTALSLRPGNGEIEEDHSHPSIRSFLELELT